MPVMPEQITKAIGETLLWASRQAECPMLKEIEIDAESAEITATVIPGDQRIVIVIQDLAG